MSKIKTLIGICEHCGRSADAKLLTDDGLCPRCDERRMRDHYNYCRQIERMINHTISVTNKNYDHATR